jgi:hypothetical protein
MRVQLKTASQSSGGFSRLSDRDGSDRIAFQPETGDLLFADFEQGWMRRLDPGQATTQVSQEAAPFASGLRRPVDLRLGADDILKKQQISFKFGSVSDKIRVAAGDNSFRCPFR